MLQASLFADFTQESLSEEDGRGFLRARVYSTFDRELRLPGVAVFIVSPHDPAPPGVQFLDDDLIRSD
jgi:hypothetical protein